MVLLDSNVIIYIASGRLDAAIIADIDIAYSSISKVEALGYQKLTVSEQQSLLIIFQNGTQIPVDEDVVTTAITCRRQIKMSSPDAIIAASAITRDIELWTADKDFEDIDNLKVKNPLKDKL